MKALIIGLIIVGLIVGAVILFGETVIAPTDDQSATKASSSSQSSSSSTELIDSNHEGTDFIPPPPTTIPPPPTAKPGTPTNSNTPTTPPPVISKNCVVGGCSGQLCVSANQGDMVTTCEWREEYACYQSARCEQQTTGECGWTPTTELNACLANAI